MALGRKGVDTADFLTRMRRLRTGLGLRDLLICGPSFSLLRAEPPPQPPAGVRYCRDLLWLRLRRAVAGCRRNCPARAESARSHPQGCEADGRPARSCDRAWSGWRAVPMGRLLARGRLRLLRARLLGVRATGRRAPTQLVRALRPGQACSEIQDEGRRPALLLRPRTCRHLHRARAHGARSALRHASASRQLGTLVLRSTARRCPTRRQGRSQAPLSIVRRCIRVLATLTTVIARCERTAPSSRRNAHGHFRLLPLRSIT
jgi:hypothetical protein